MPCIGSCLYYLGGVASDLLMDAGMTGKAKAHQTIKPTVECKPSHLFFGSGCLDWHDVMHAPCTGDDALLQTFLTQSVGAPEFRNPQFLPLAAVIDVLLVFPLLQVLASPAHTVTMLTNVTDIWNGSSSSKMSLSFTFSTASA
jgi:hypothetical protein